MISAKAAISTYGLACLLFFKLVFASTKKPIVPAQIQSSVQLLRGVEDLSVYGAFSLQLCSVAHPRSLWVFLSGWTFSMANTVMKICLLCFFTLWSTNSNSALFKLGFSFVLILNSSFSCSVYLWPRRAKSRLTYEMVISSTLLMFQSSPPRILKRFKISIW